MPWYALYTRSRNEKKVADQLEKKGVTVYCPLQEEVRQWSDRKKRVKVPVFRSYVFVHLDDYQQESLLVLETQGAVRFVWWQGKPGIVRDNEIEEIKQFLEEYKGADISTTEYRPGERIQIAGGPLKEKEGIIVDIQNKKAILSIESLGVNLVAQLPIAMLRHKESPRK